MGTSDSSSRMELSEYVVVASKLRVVDCGNVPLLYEMLRRCKMELSDWCVLVDTFRPWPRNDTGG